MQTVSLSHFLPVYSFAYGKKESTGQYLNPKEDHQIRKEAIYNEKFFSAANFPYRLNLSQNY